MTRWYIGYYDTLSMYRDGFDSRTSRLCGLVVSLKTTKMLLWCNWTAHFATDEAVGIRVFLGALEKEKVIHGEACLISINSDAESS